ncbi:BRE1 E3 ubiquitin ligase domain containing protein [Naviculisporaceae sp. PSN 640]
MPSATSLATSPRPATLVKMEDRKRPAAGAVDDLAPPPTKRQAVNGTSKSKDDSADMKEEVWIEEYQKGAIYRQMLEYKREKSNLEARLQDIEKRAVHHDDHIRVMDAWWLQFLEEIELLAEGIVSSTSTSSGAHFGGQSSPGVCHHLTSTGSPPVTALAFKDSKDFQRHLNDKGKALMSKVERIFKKFSGARGEVKPEIAQLEDQVKSLLAAQKDLTVKIDRLEQENRAISEQYDAAALKVIKAERKLDRLRSAQVHKLEQQAIARSTRQPSTADENGSGSGMSNGDSEALKLQYDEAVAVVAKQKEQLEAALAEIKGLKDENATFKVKKEAITDEDYARTEVFKLFKGQNEDLIKRVNNLEATNKQLSEEAEKLRKERSHYRAQIESEAQALTSELEDQIQQKDQDLTRIRTARDELLTELAQRKASQDQEKTAATHIKELIDATNGRVEELESEVARLRPSEDAIMTTPREELESMDAQKLQQKYLDLERDYQAINKEILLLEKAYKKSQALAQKKVLDFAALEERVAILTAEKSKADQKYFAARKDTDIRTAEIRTLRGQNGKSSEIISQLKDVETQNRSLISTLEKQVSDLKQANSVVMAENKKLESSNAEAVRRAEAVKTQISDLTNLVRSKDAAAMAAKEQLMNQQQEHEKLKVRLNNANREVEKWKQKARGNSSEDEEMLRSLVLCTVCRDKLKNTYLKNCGHVFCSECVDLRLANRMRKCPTCNKPFDKADVLPAHL